MYEEIKAILQELDLTPEQYEEAIYKVAEVLSI